MARACRKQKYSFPPAAPPGATRLRIILARYEQPGDEQRTRQPHRQICSPSLPSPVLLDAHVYVLMYITRAIEDWRRWHQSDGSSYIIRIGRFLPIVWFWPAKLPLAALSWAESSTR